MKTSIVALLCFVMLIAFMAVPTWAYAGHVAVMVSSPRPTLASRIRANRYERSILRSQRRAVASAGSHGVASPGFVFTDPYTTVIVESDGSHGSTPTAGSHGN